MDAAEGAGAPGGVARLARQHAARARGAARRHARALAPAVGARAPRALRAARRAPRHSAVVAGVVGVARLPARRRHPHVASPALAPR